MTTKAKGPFWLDGGYDRETVEACPYHPRHRWWTFRIGDVLECSRTTRDPDELMTICRACFVPRCGDTADPDRCLNPRHHRDPHIGEKSRQMEPVGG